MVVGPVVETSESFKGMSSRASKNLKNVMCKPYLVIKRGSKNLKGVTFDRIN